MVLVFVNCLKMASTLLVFFCITVELAFSSGTQVDQHENRILEDLKYYEVIRPELHFEGRRRRDLSTRTPYGHVDRAVLSLSGFGQEFFLDVSRNRALFRVDYVERHFLSDGSEVITKPDETEHCFYQGEVQGQSRSTVAISTCHGIEGMIQDGNQSYYIHPIKQNHSQVYHIMYRMEDLKLPLIRYGEPSFAEKLPFKNVHSHRRSRRNVLTETKHVELVIVNDYQQYMKFKKNITATNHRAKMIANLVDSMYRKINIRIVLITVKTWSNGDRVVVESSSDNTLDSFLKYRNGELWKEVKNDNAQLLTNIKFDGAIVGKAQLSAMCTTRSGGVVQDHSENAAATAATLAHEMGHNFGMNHDKDNCECASAESSQGCIMSAVARSKPSTEWSSCSVKDLEVLLEKDLDSCLFNTPKTLFGDPVCGNGFKEEGEECDCGTVEECKAFTDDCCNATTCKMHDFAECSSGPCCDKCKIKKPREVCREKVNECDLPELCTGKSALCPSNKYRQDGIPCAGGNGVCYRGMCPTHDAQCQYAFGKAAKSGPRLCYLTNMQGSDHGYCHQEDKKFEKCEEKDINCGALQCTNIKTRLPIVGAERRIYSRQYTLPDGVVKCSAFSLSIGVDIADPGVTQEGTKCGDSKVCLNRKCVELEELTSKVQPCKNNCTTHGICNNEGECFCDACWGGADCSEIVPCDGSEKKDEQDGGSDGGGSQTDSSTVAIVVVCLLMVILVVLGVLAFVFRERLKQKWGHFRQGSPAKAYKHVGQKAAPRAPPSVPSGARPTISVPTFQSTTHEIPVETITANVYEEPEWPSKRASCPPADPKPLPKAPVSRRPGSDAIVLDKPRLPPVPSQGAKPDPPSKPLPPAGVQPKVGGAPARPRPPSVSRQTEGVQPAKAEPPVKPRPPPLPKHVQADKPRPTSVPVKPPPPAAKPTAPGPDAGQDRPTSVPMKPSQIKQAQGRPFSVASATPAKPIPLPKSVRSEPDRPASSLVKPSQIKQAQSRPSSAASVPPVAVKPTLPVPPVPRKPPKPNV